MQLASALQTSVKFDLHAARVVILLLALTSLLLPAASETLRQASDAPLNSLVHSSKEAGSDAVAAGAEGPPTANSSQHPVACNRPEPSPETKVRGSDDAAPLVCHTSELLHAFVPPAADSCPAEGIVDKSAHGAHPKPACLPATSLQMLCFACLYVACLIELLPFHHVYFSIVVLVPAGRPYPFITCCNCFPLGHCTTFHACHCSR